MTSYIIAHITLFWFLLGAVFIFFELMIPGGFVLFLMGIAAWTIGFLSLGLSLSLPIQIVLFLLAALMYTLLLKENLKSLLKRIDHKDHDPENEFIGKKAQALTKINQDEGKVEFKGTQWPAKSDQPISPGEDVLILDQQSITLLVKSLKS